MRVYWLWLEVVQLAKLCCDLRNLKIADYVSGRYEWKKLLSMVETVFLVLLSLLCSLLVGSSQTTVA